MKKLTKKQVEIMKIFWASEHPLAASDILKLDESMNINTIRASIQSILFLILQELTIKFLKNLWLLNL